MPASTASTIGRPCAHRLRWATLLARVFSSDLSACATCGGRLRIVAALTDPDLSGGGRAAGGAPAEGPAAAAVRVRRLTCLLDPAPGVRRGVPSTLPQAPNCSGSGPTGNQNGLRARSKDGQTILRELPDPGGALSALTESPKRSSFYLYFRARPNRMSPTGTDLQAARTADIRHTDRVMPPSTRRFCPVMYPEPGVRRKAAVLRSPPRFRNAPWECAT